MMPLSVTAGRSTSPLARWRYVLLRFGAGATLLAVPVVTAEHLCAIALQTGRPKDYLRVYSLIQSGCVTTAKLRQLIQTYGLQERWNDYARRYA